MAGKRAVGGIRLSSLTEETTSPGRQRDLEQNWADLNNTEIVGWAEDLDVSAGIPPWDRPQLGAWLKRPDEFDILIFAKLDRAVRSLNDFVLLDQWCTKHNVSLVILDPPLDLTDMWGRAMAQILATFAELERKMIGKRIKEGYDELIRAGRWPGGRIPFGYRKTRIEGRDGWWLVLHEEQAAVLRKIVSRIIGGASTRSQIHWLNQQGIKTSRGNKAWAYSTLYQVLRSPSLMGLTPLPTGDVARDENGLPIQRGEPIIARPEWERLQVALDANSQNRGGTRYDAAPLLRVAFCGRCERPQYRKGDNRVTTKGEPRSHFYYSCASSTIAGVENCPDKPYRALDLETIVFDAFLSLMGDVEVHEKLWVPGENHSDELETAQAAMGDLTQQLTITRSVSGRKRIIDQITALDGRIADLEILPNRPGQWAYEGTAETYNQLWERLNDAERGALLRDSGVRALVQRRDDGTPVAALVLPDDLAERAKEWAANRAAA